MIHLDELKGAPGIRAVAGVFVPALNLIFLSVWLSHDSNKVEMIESLDKPLREAVAKLPLKPSPSVDDLDPLGLLGGGGGGGGKKDNSGDKVQGIDRIVISMDSNDYSGQKLNTKEVK